MLIDLLRPFGVFATPTTQGGIANQLAYEERRLPLLQGAVTRAKDAGEATGPHQDAVDACEAEIAFLKIRQRDADAHVAELRKKIPGIGDVIKREMETAFGTWKRKA